MTRYGLTINPGVFVATGKDSRGRIHRGIDVEEEIARHWKQTTAGTRGRLKRQATRKTRRLKAVDDVKVEAAKAGKPLLSRAAVIEAANLRLAPADRLTVGSYDRLWRRHKSPA